MSSQANITIINGTPYFTRPEIERGNKKALQFIDTDFLQEVVEFRRWHGYSTLITSFYRAGSGAHGEGRACDQVLFSEYGKTPIHPLELYYRAASWPFRGAGLYFDWAFTNREGTQQRTPGIHIDNSQDRPRPLRWFAVTYNKDNDTVSPLLLPKAQRATCKRVFYYQDPTDGLFKSRERNERFTIEQAVKYFYWND